MALPSTFPVLAPYITITGATRAIFNARTSPVPAGNPIHFMSAGAATLYGVNHPGTNTAARVARFAGDGTTVTFTVPTLSPVFTTLPLTADAALTAALYLQVIALVYPTGMVQSATIRERVGQDATPTAAQWKVASATTITFATAPTVGQVVELIVPDATTITQLTGGALTASRIYDGKAYDFMTAGVAGVSLFQANNV